MKIDFNQVREALKSYDRLTAEELAGHLNLEITQDNRKEILRSVRSAARKIVDSLGGARTETNSRGETLYELPDFQ